jgi:phosphate transport system substrate-binding protein
LHGSYYSENLVSMKKLLLLVAALVFCSGCRQAADRSMSSLPSNNGPIRISGAYALYPLMKIWVTEFEKSHPDVSFEITAIGSGGGVDQLIAGRCDLAMVSADVDKSQDTLVMMMPVANLSVVPVINPKNPYLGQIQKKGITREHLMALFTGEGPGTWGDLYGNKGRDPVHVFVRSDKSGATIVLSRYLQVEPQEIRGEGKEGEENLLAAVKADPLALGYCNFIYAVDPQTADFSQGLCVLPLDGNDNGIMEPRENFYDSAGNLQRAMWSGKYPYSLKRNLMLACMGLPKTKEIAEFLYYCVTDGQNLVGKAGYVELHSSELKCRIELLENLLKPVVKEAN